MRRLLGHYILICFLRASVVKAAFEANAYIALVRGITKHTNISNCWVCGKADQFNSPLSGIPLSNWTDLDPHALCETSNKCRTANVTSEGVPFAMTVVNTSIFYVLYNASTPVNLGTLNRTFGNWSRIAMLLKPSIGVSQRGEYTNGTLKQS